jgi:PemK-like, MazF-like toxin of type II toxin-antitoxin system
VRRGLIGQLIDGLQQILRPTRSRSTSSKRGSGSGPSGATEVRDRDLAFEYSPCLDGDPDPGEVVWTWVPYEDDPSQGKDRPVAIIGRRGSHLLGVPLTSKEKHNESQVPIDTGSWDREGRVSYAKVERVLDIVPTSVRREGAVLSRAHYDHIVAGVERARRAR